MPPQLIGLPLVRPGGTPNTRETVNLQADLPRVAEEVHLPVVEDVSSAQGSEGVSNDVPAPALGQGSRRSLRPTLARRARAGDPSANYQLIVA